MASMTVELSGMNWDRRTEGGRVGCCLGWLVDWLGSGSGVSPARVLTPSREVRYSTSTTDCSMLRLRYAFNAQASVQWHDKDKEC